jgi:hypothetical protein
MLAICFIGANTQLRSWAFRAEPQAQSMAHAIDPGRNLTYHRGDTSWEMLGRQSAATITCGEALSLG